MLTLLEKRTTLGGFRAIVYDKGGKVQECTPDMLERDATERAHSMARQNPGLLVEVVEVCAAYKGAVQVYTIEEGDVKLLPAPARVA